MAGGETPPLRIEDVFSLIEARCNSAFSSGEGGPLAVDEESIILVNERRTSAFPLRGRCRGTRRMRCYKRFLRTNDRDTDS